MSELLRFYAPEECHPPGEHRRGWSLTGYPFAWAKCPGCDGRGRPDGGHYCWLCQGAGSIKDLVRQLAGHRCVRCGHPFQVGQSGEWESRSIASIRTETTREIIAYDDPKLFDDLDPEDVGQAQPEPRAIQWSDCDEHCTHGPPIRLRFEGWSDWQEMTGPSPAWTALEPSNVAQVQAAWRILTVHHLNENKADCRWWNLAALCQRCHLEIQGKVNMAQVWPHEHTPWFKPYAAGFYAATYLNEDLTREETMDRLAELLALERVA